MLRQSALTQNHIRRPDWVILHKINRVNALMQTSRPTKMKAMSRRKARVALRKAGLRPVTIWVPDIRCAGFAEECCRQSLLLQGDTHGRSVLDQVAALSGTKDWQ